MPQNRLQLVPLLSRFAKAAAREVGARHLEDEVCRPTLIPSPAGSKIKDAWTTGCGGESKFEIPVTGDAGADLRRPEPATVCVVDDMAYLFPRYGGEALDAS